MYGEHEVFEFDEIYPATERDDPSRKRTLIVGNGFTQAAVGRAFSYENLKTNINHTNLTIGVNLNNLFDRIGTADFEAAIQQLVDSSNLDNDYGLTAEAVAKANDAEQLKRELVTSISIEHPLHPWHQIDDQQYQSTGTFIRHFRIVFSTNYDLTLYWTVMCTDLHRDYFDGFNYNHERLLSWNGDDQHIFYIHGGLHLFEEGPDLVKIRFNQGGENLIDQITNKLQSNVFPLTVAEGSHQAKMDKIIHHSYLKNCYEALKNNSRPIVTYGLSFRQDEHIIKAIENSNCPAIDIGIYNPNPVEISAMKAKLASTIHNRSGALRPLNVRYWDTTNLQIW
tara:strand:+ start:5923 stop:6936 length:1014 start_codon:yes stop_codon:yes gene_type:complete